MKATVFVKTRGRVIIPATVRRALDVEEGDPVELDVRPVPEEVAAAPE